MSWFEALAEWIEKRGGKRQIFRTEKDLEPKLYLERFYIIKCPLLEVMIHRFYMSDLPVPHDHPWASCNVILKGGYIEHVVQKNIETAHFRKPGYFGRRLADAQHWVELPEGLMGEVWTLFVTFRREKSWGFFTEDRYYPFEEYFRLTGVDTVNHSAEDYRGWLFPARSPNS